MEIPPTENALPELLERDPPESNQLLLVPSFCFSRKGQFPDTAGDFVAFDNDLHSQTTLLFSRMHILDIPVDELDNNWVRPTVQAIRYRHALLPCRSRDHLTVCSQPLMCGRQSLSLLYKCEESKNRPGMVAAMERLSDGCNRLVLAARPLRLVCRALMLFQPTIRLKRLLSSNVSFHD